MAVLIYEIDPKFSINGQLEMRSQLFNFEHFLISKVT